VYFSGNYKAGIIPRIIYVIGYLDISGSCSVGELIQAFEFGLNPSGMRNSMGSHFEADDGDSTGTNMANSKFV